MKIAVSLLFALLFGFAHGQDLGIVIINPGADTNICRGDSVNLEATWPLLSTDFDNGSMGIGWSSTQANPVFTNPCGPGPKGSHLWVGTTPSINRTLVTSTYDLTRGGACYVEFWMRYGLVPDSGPCEDPDFFTEGVHLQFSTNNGLTWTDFPGPDIEPIGNLSTTPPFNTQVPGSGGYWAPYTFNIQQSQSTLYYWNLYRCPIPPAAITTATIFRWAQLSTSNAGYDAWGIDEVIIGCEPPNLIWNTGNTTTTDTVGPAQTTIYWVQATYSNMTTATDSIKVTVNSPSFNLPYDTIISCGQDSLLLDAGAGWNNYLWSNGEQNRQTYISQPGDYFVEVKDNLGCIASDTIHVELHKKLSLLNRQVCDSLLSASGRYTWKNSGVFTDTILASNGCDSIIETHLVVHPIFDTLIEAQICQGDPYRLPGGNVVTHGGLYRDTMATVRGCDSIVRTNLIVHPVFSATDSGSICQGEVFILPDSRPVFSSGNYLSNLQSVHGCDSLVTTALRVLPAYNTTLNPSICDKETYVLPSSLAVNHEGVYIDALTTIAGCDSIIETHLVVHPIFDTLIEAQICQGDSYRLPDGNVVTHGGLYRDTMATVRGCDSVVFTNLSVFPTYYITSFDSMCIGGNYTFPNGLVVNNPGVYLDTFNTRKGCDSIVSTILTTYPAYKTELNLVKGYCYDSLYISASISGGTPPYSFLWNNGSTENKLKQPEAGLNYMEVTDQNGCKSYDSIWVVVPSSKKLRIVKKFPDTFFIDDNPLNLNAFYNTRIIEWNWIVNQRDTFYKPSFDYSFSDTGTHEIYLRVKTKDSCIYDTVYFIQVFIPNAFTPNGDGLNEQFSPHYNKEYYKGYEMIISDRWGRIVFKSSKSKPWNGLIDGRPAISGTYVYKIIATDRWGEKYYYRGSFQLIK